MTINTKYKIGEEIFIIWKDDSTIKIKKDVIKEITLTKKSITYYGQDFCDEIAEEEIIPTTRTDLLGEKIKELFKTEEY